MEFNVIGFIVLGIGVNIAALTFRTTFIRVVIWADERSFWLSMALGLMLVPAFTINAAIARFKADLYQRKERSNQGERK